MRRLSLTEERISASILMSLSAKEVVPSVPGISIEPVCFFSIAGRISVNNSQQSRAMIKMIVSTSKTARILRRVSIMAESP